MLIFIYIKKVWMFMFESGPSKTEREKFCFNSKALLELVNAAEFML